MSPASRLLRRIPFIRWCAMQRIIRLRQRQSDESWAHVQSVLIAVGNMTIMWAGIGLMLNNLIEWHQAKIGTAVRRDFPRNFSTKLGYLKAMERDTRWTADERAKLYAIRLELARLNEFRKNMVHGLLHQKNKRTRDWHIYIAKEEGNGLLRRSISHSYADIMAASEAMAAISHEISPFFARIIGVPHPANQ